MTKKKSTHNPPKAQGHELPPLLPLEYCRIDRAARMLECEVDDLIHWGAVGAINLCLMLKSTSVLRGELLINRLSGNRFPGSAREQTLPEDEFTARILSAVNLSALIDDFLSKSNLSKFTPSPESASDLMGSLMDTSLSMRVEGKASGVWTLDYRYASEIEQDGEAEISYFHPLVDESRSSPKGVARFHLNLDDFTVITKGDIWIKSSDLEKLHHSITTGEPLPNIHNNAELAQRAREQEASTQAKPPHHSAERHAVNREPVLMAAIYCKTYFPEQCRTYVAWAETIDQKAQLFWPETHQPPLGRSTIERLLGEAHRSPGDDAAKGDVDDE